MKFLLIDDHPMILEGYIAILKPLYGEWDFCKAQTVAEFLTIYRNQGPFSVFVIDYNLIGCEVSGVFNGVDLAKKIKQENPQAKILIITAHEEILRVYHIHKKVFPDGLLIKSDVSPELLSQAVARLLSGGRFYSPRAVLCISEMAKKELLREDYNLQILMMLSKGHKPTSIGSQLFMSKSAIQRRLMRMREAFDVTDNEALVEEALNQGFV